MHWLRAHMMFGSWSALFALMVQLVMSFGHIHFAGPSLRLNLASHVLQLAIQAAPTSVDSPTIPVQHKPGGLADDFCAICSVTQLAVVTALVPDFPMPIGSIGISLDPSVEFAFAASSPRFFRARAPPSA